MRMVYSEDKGGTTDIAVPTADRERFCLQDAEVLQLADLAIKIENHYSEIAGNPMPMDIEWAKDANDGQLYVIQARPETVASQRVAQVPRSGVGHGPASGREDCHRTRAGQFRSSRTHKLSAG